MAATVLQITNASVKFGAVADPIVPATLTEFNCQVTRAEIVSTNQTTTTSVPATFCQPASETVVPVSSTFQLNLEWLQDWTLTVATSLSAFMYTFDAEKKAFALYLNASANPVATGIVTCQAGAFAGAPGEPLVSSVTLQIDGKPALMDMAGAPIPTATTTASETTSASESSLESSDELSSAAA